MMTLSRYFLPNGSVSFWHTELRPIFYSYPTLQDYYIDFTAKTHYDGPYDSQGIPLLDYKGAIGRQYNPCAVAQFALGWFTRWKRGDATARTRFEKTACWLHDRLAIDSVGHGWWWYHFDFDAYGLTSPWKSALAQGQGISVLLRAYKEFGDDRYLKAAHAAYAGMVTPVEQGGLLRHFDGGIILEEVIADRPTAILDGLMFAIFGVQDFCFATGDEGASKLRHECLGTLERLLPRFDLHYWSRADLYHDAPPMIASPFYHRLHVAQLEVLRDLTGSVVFDQYARRWKEQDAHVWNRIRAIGNKAYFKLRYY
jgi:hypothetical protein